MPSILLLHTIWHPLYSLLQSHSAINNSVPSVSQDIPCQDKEHQQYNFCYQNTRSLLKVMSHSTRLNTFVLTLNHALLRLLWLVAHIILIPHFFGTDDFQNPQQIIQAYMANIRIANMVA